MYKYEIGDFPTWGAQGWICPKCGRVYSPNTSMCPYCNGQTKTFPTTTTIDDDWWKKYLQHSSTGNNEDTTNIWKHYLNQMTNIEDYPYDIRNPTNIMNEDTFRVHFEDLPKYDY